MRKRNPETKAMKPACKLFSILALGLLLGACDGGIKGTGGPVIDMDASTDSADSSATDMDGGAGAIQEASSPDDMTMDSGPSESGAAPTGSFVAPEQLPSDSSFTTNFDATLRSDAVVKVVHGVSGMGPVVAILNQNVDMPLISSPGLSFGEGSEQYLSLVPDTYELDLLDANEFSMQSGVLPMQLAGVYPLTMSAGSAGTLIFRGLSPTVRPDETAADDYPLEVFAVPNILSTNSASSVQFRIIHAAPQFDGEGSVDVYINSTSAPSPTSGIPIFEDFDYADANTGYFETSADSYNITITESNGLTQRIATLDPLMPSPSSSTTIILLDDPDGVAGVDVKILILNDGDRTGLEP